VDTCQNAIDLAILALGGSFIRRDLSIAEEQRTEVRNLLARVQTEIATLRAVDLNDMTIAIALTLPLYDDLLTR
jgi:hypothetical protein